MIKGLDSIRLFLPAQQGQPFSLTIDNAAAATHSLDVAIIWFPIGMILAIPDALPLATGVGWLM